MVGYTRRVPVNHYTPRVADFTAAGAAPRTPDGLGLRFQKSTILLVASLTAWLGAFAQAQDARVSIPVRVPHGAESFTNRSGAIRVDVNLVLVPVAVTDPYQRPVRGLEKSAFHIFEDGVEREISQFFSDELPISVGIVFDASGSMSRKMDESRRAVVEFLKMSMPGDEFFLSKFSDQPENVCDFTTNTALIEDGLETIKPNGWTSLYDAIYLSMHDMKRAKHDRKVLLVLSDGGDNNSRYTEREIKQLVKESDVRIFSISILDRSTSLEAIAEESGGRAFRVRKLEELADLATNISAEMHTHYVLGFSPPDRLKDGKYHRVRVDVTPPAGNPGIHAAWKHGYYDPLL
jgi:Ca-activated chloride channel homolog